MQDLIILSDVESLLPPLSEEEYETLKESVKTEGIRDALIVWNNTIMDGHHRYRLAKELGIPFETREMTFDSLDDAKLWIIKNQSARRNLSSYARTEIALKLKTEIAEKNKERQVRKPKDFVWQNSAEQKNATRDQLAQYANVSRDTVSRVEFIEKNADEETKTLLRTGEISINKVYNQLKKGNESPIVVQKVDATSIKTQSEEIVPAPHEPNLKAVLSSVREPCVTLQMINRVNPESLVDALFNLFDVEYRRKFAEMLIERTIDVDGKENAASLLSVLDQLVH